MKNRQAGVLLSLTLGLIGLVFLGFEGALAESGRDDVLESLNRCSASSDCDWGPVANPGCFHYCVGQECAKAMTCPVFNRKASNFPDCYVSTACDRRSGKIVCIRGRCSLEQNL